MSLKYFHIVFITLSLVLSLTLLMWGFENYKIDNNKTDLALAGVGLLGIVCLLPYGLWFRKEMKKLLPIVIAWAILESPLLSSQAWACSVCYGDPNSSLVHGAKLGALVMMAVVAGVLGTILGIAISWAKKAKAIENL